LKPILIGKDPMRSKYIVTLLQTKTRQTRSGLIGKAIAAIENALLNVRGNALGLPVYALYGRPIREEIPVYWSHFVSYRAYFPQYMQGAPFRNCDDLARHAEEVKGFTELKTNILPSDGSRLIPSTR